MQKRRISICYLGAMLFVVGLLLPLRGDLWVDPGWGTPLDWGRDLYKYGAPRYTVYEDDEDTRNRYNVTDEDQNVIYARKPTLETEPPKPPQRIATMDIWGHWRVQLPEQGKGSRYAVGEEGYSVTDGDNLKDVKTAPHVPKTYNDMILAYYFTRTAFPYFVDEHQLKSYLVEIGFPAVKPSIGAMQDERVFNLASDVASTIVNKKLNSLKTGQGFFYKYNPFANIKIPKGPSDSLPKLVHRLVHETLVQHYWGQPGFAAYLESHPELLEMALPVARELTKHKAPIMKQNALGFLRQVKDLEAGPIFLKALTGKDAVMRERSWKGLFLLGDEELLKWIDKTATKSDEAAARALYVWGKRGLMTKSRVSWALKKAKKNQMVVPALLALVESKTDSKSVSSFYKKLAKHLKFEKQPVQGRGVVAGLKHRAPQVYQAMLACAGLARLGEEKYLKKLEDNFQLYLDTVMARKELGQPGNVWPYPEHLDQVWMQVLELIKPVLTESFEKKIHKAVGNVQLSQGFRTRLLRNFPPAKSEPMEELLHTLALDVAKPPTGWWGLQPDGVLASTALYYLHQINSEKALGVINLWMGTVKMSEAEKKAIQAEIDALTKARNELLRKRPKNAQSKDYQVWYKKYQGLFIKIKDLTRKITSADKGMLERYLPLLRGSEVDVNKERARLQKELADLQKNRPNHKDRKAWQAYVKKLQDLNHQLRSLNQSHELGSMVYTAVGTVIDIWAQENKIDNLEKLLLDWTPVAPIGDKLISYLMRLDPKRGLKACRALLVDPQAPPQLLGAALYQLSLSGKFNRNDGQAVVNLLTHKRPEVRLVAYLALRKKLNKDTPFVDWFEEKEEKIQKAQTEWRASILILPAPKIESEDPEPKEGEVEKNEPVPAE